jgi:hypothetical protein
MPDVIIITSPGPQGPPGPSGQATSTFPFTGSAIISGSLITTGSVTATQGFTGSLFGSSSYALTASFALNGGGGGVGFPFSGSAIITGSLEILYSGSNNILTVTSESNTLFQITNDNTDNVFEVYLPNDLLVFPVFAISSSNQSEFRGPVLGSFTGSLLGTASFALNSGDSFPFTGSAGISGSLDLNGPLNIGTTNLVTKSINLGQIETVFEEASPSNRADQNTITFNRNLDISTPAIHTRINFNGRYWAINQDDYYYASADTNNHFLQFNSNRGPDQFYGVFSRCIDLQFRTQPRGASAKGFSTDYNGTTYLNVTGSVSASAYFGNGST